MFVFSDQKTVISVQYKQIKNKKHDITEQHNKTFFTN